MKLMVEVPDGTRDRENDMLELVKRFAIQTVKAQILSEQQAEEMLEMATKNLAHSSHTADLRAADDSVR